jgi:hypothetical protein
MIFALAGEIRREEDLIRPKKIRVVFGGERQNARRTRHQRTGINFFPVNMS